jgi:hypothetical protein
LDAHVPPKARGDIHFSQAQGVFAQAPAELYDAQEEIPWRWQQQFTS